jgi:hypothetical protein
LQLQESDKLALVLGFCKSPSACLQGCHHPPRSTHKEELQTVFFSLKELDAVMSTVDANLREDDDNDEELDDKADDEDCSDMLLNDQTQLKGLHCKLSV